MSDIDNTDNSAIISKILPNLFIGSRYSASIDVVDQLYITHVYQIGFTIENHLKSFHANYSFIDLHDTPNDSYKMIERGFEFINNITVQMENTTNKILLCCQNGNSCSPSIIILYLMSIDFTFKEAYDHILRKRTIKLNRGFEIVLKHTRFSKTLEGYTSNIYDETKKNILLDEN